MTYHDIIGGLGAAMFGFCISWLRTRSHIDRLEADHEEAVRHAHQDGLAKGWFKGQLKGREDMRKHINRVQHAIDEQMLPRG